jgi:hypothetical protein
MRSLWRIMAANWLGGEGSAALSGESSPLDFFDRDLWSIKRKSFFAELGSGVSHGAMLIAREGASALFALCEFAEGGYALQPLPIAA